MSFFCLFVFLFKVTLFYQRNFKKNTTQLKNEMKKVNIKIIKKPNFTEAHVVRSLYSDHLLLGLTGTHCGMISLL